jgi:AraC-like DNA-binding protein
VRARRLLLPTLLALALPASLAAAGAPLDTEIPHRRGRLRVDGDGADWGRTGATIELARPEMRGEATTRAVVRLAWDRQTLWALFDVADATVHLAPPGVGGARLFQWDSVEIYLGGGGDRPERMGPDDFQFILSPDGRAAALQGDLLLHELEAMEVPKRERPALAVAVAGRVRPGGYLVECAIPLAAVGITPRTGQRLALDLAFNDWTSDHPPLDQLAYDLGTLHKIERLPQDGSPVFDRHGLAREGAAQIERDSYRPWAWSGSDDFGHPSTWNVVRLVGAPPFPERVVDALGPAATLVAAGSAAVCLVIAASAVSAWRHRRRMVALLDRLGALEARNLAAASPAPTTEPGAAALAGGVMASPSAVLAAEPSSPPAPPAALEWLVHAAESEPSSGRSERLELGVMRTVKSWLADSLTPADLAAALFVSLRTLQRHLAETLSCTPGELILAVKMREARRLLERGDWQVQEVARRVGFAEPGYFARRFRAYFGVAPAAFLAARRARPGARRPAA